MKSKILATLVVVGTLATASLAYNQNCPNAGQRGMMMQGQGMQQGMMMQGQGMPQKGMMQGQGMMNKGQKMFNRGMGRQGGMQMFSMLNLSDDQRFQLSVLRDEMRLEMKKSRGSMMRQNRMASFISESGFDKDAFIKDSNARHESMRELRAAHMEKAFKILTKEQVAQLKKNLNN